jgi:transcriptional regulator with XRE-family HTH domain
MLKSYGLEIMTNTIQRLKGIRKQLKLGCVTTEKLSKMDRLEIDNILKIDELNNELEFERATSIHGKLRWMVEDDSSLVKKYESKHWENESAITEGQIKESDNAEKIVNAENVFIQKRKELIKGKLNENELSQKDLAKILGHRPNYMSELINGVRPFSRDDIVVIHRLFGLEFKDLIPPFLKKEVTNHIKMTLGEMKNKRVRLKINDLEAV